MYERVFLNTIPTNDANVRYMYRDLSNIEFYNLHYLYYLEYTKNNPTDMLLVIGCSPRFFNSLAKKEYKSFDQAFYNISGVPYHYRWDKFYFNRDTEREKDAFYNKIGLKDGEDYIFIHEDPARGRLINRSYITSKYRIVSASDYPDIGVFDFLYVIEKAKEIHVMDSCFLALIDNMQINRDMMIIHNYDSNSVVFPTAVKMRWNLLIDKSVVPNELYCNDNNL
jgi:hypothetical protein